MREEHGASIEKIGSGLVSSVETYKGCSLQFVRRTSGFNGLSVYKSGEVRKIEIKTMQKSDYWISINGIRAIDKLFFERDYWLYFVLVPENIVVMTKALPFLRFQLSLDKKLNFLDELEGWIKSTKRLSKNSGLKFLPKINIKLSTPIRKLVEEILSGEYNFDWKNSVIEIWKMEATWKQLFIVQEE
ncbi:MAG: hypothetical protein B6242_00770 [Anaerolineaceae bacterium 4572_78]|nr:MAG: hypothetical protein B6242_00770 [Anaerolineaceae bacterium 4572_78]